MGLLGSGLCSSGALSLAVLRMGRREIALECFTMGVSGVSQPFATRPTHAAMMVIACGNERVCVGFFTLLRGVLAQVKLNSQC